jgi:hypothetical protein
MGVPHALQLSRIGTYSRQCGHRVKLCPDAGFRLASADRSRCRPAVFARAAPAMAPNRSDGPISRESRATKESDSFSDRFLRLRSSVMPPSLLWFPCPAFVRLPSSLIERTVWSFGRRVRAPAHRPPARLGDRSGHLALAQLERKLRFLGRRRRELLHLMHVAHELQRRA